MTEPAERRLAGGWQTEVHEADGIVYRSAKPQSATVLALLRHLAASGFEAAPVPVGEGLGADGRETLRYIDGNIQHPRPWSDEALSVLGALLRRLHEATSTFTEPADAMWRSSFARSLPSARRVIGHGDLGPWNIIERAGLPVALIDWDNGGPVGSMWELAQAAWLNVQLHDDDVAEDHGLGNPEDRGRQLRVFLDGYGLARDERGEFVSCVAEFAIHEARQEALEAGVTCDSAAAVAENGYPTMWAIAWRARSASWILRHRAVLSAAVTAR